MITKEDLAPKIANFTGVCMVGWGAQTCPHHTNVGKNFRFRRITYFETLFAVVLMHFP